VNFKGGIDGFVVMAGLDLGVAGLAGVDFDILSNSGLDS
jgi:hypothetical protein